MRQRFTWLCVAVLGLATLAPAAAPAATPPGQETPAQLYKRLAPAVVGINCKLARLRGTFDYFGTGVVVSPDGLILTTATVVPPGATDIQVYFTNGDVLSATLEESDAGTEGTVIRVKPGKTPLVYMPLADSRRCRVGDPALTWGNPYYAIQADGAVSLSAGVVSGLYKLNSADEQAKYVGDVVETDAAVNAGSDGGAVTDACGNLLGIISLAYSPTRFLGAAVPSQKLHAALPSLAKLPLAEPAELAGAARDAWALQAAMQRAAQGAADAVITVRAVHEGEKQTVPAKRADDKPQGGEPREEDQLPALAVGSGFVVDPAGIAVTSASVLGTGKLDKLYAYLPDGRRVPAKLLGKDRVFDLAVIELELPKGETLKALSLTAGDRTPRVGEAAAVLGRSEPPGGLTINVGSISALERLRNTCTQLSALVNYGNLGGPVIDMHGRLLGMACHLNDKTEWRQNCGVGFSLDAGEIAAALPKLKAGEKFQHPKSAFMGVGGDSGALDVKGARIQRVAKDSAAAKAGIKPGDTITQFGDKPVTNWLDLWRAMDASEPGQKVPLTINRKGETVNLEITLGEAE